MSGYRKSGLSALDEFVQHDTDSACNTGDIDVDALKLNAALTFTECAFRPHEAAQLEEASDSTVTTSRLDLS